MKLHSVNINEFKNLVKTCSGRICFITAEGDQLVLNSRLSDRIGLEPILKVARHRDVTIQCDNQQDQDKIEAFLSLD